MQEALNSALEESFRPFEDTAANPCPGSCHTSTPIPRRLAYRAPAALSPVVVERVRRLATAEGATSWRGAIRDFEQTSSLLDDLLLSVLPANSPELQQLEFATELHSRIESLHQNNPEARRIPAVFYPEYEFGEDGQARGYSWYLFLSFEDGNYVLRDLTKGIVAVNRRDPSARDGLESFFAMRFGASEASVSYPDSAMSDLFGELNSRLRFPKGMLHYTLPGGRSRELRTTMPTEMSDWLAAAGLTLVAIGIIALTAGAGTPAALAFAGSAAFGAAGTAMALHEKEEQGLATQQDRNESMVFIAADLLSVLTLGLGRIAAAPATFGRMAGIAGRLYAPVKAMELSANVAQAYVMTDQFVQQFEALHRMPESEERDSAVLRLLAISIATGALQLYAIRSDVSDLARGLRPRMTADASGGLSHHVDDVPTTSTTARTATSVGENASGTGLLRPPRGETRIDDAIEGGGAVVRIERQSNGLVTGVHVAHGPGAGARDIATHEAIAEMVRNYGGLQGRIRIWWRELLARWGHRRPPYELELEVFKLEEMVRRRVTLLETRGTSSAVRAEARRRLPALETQLETARANARRALEAPEAMGESAEIWARGAPKGYPDAPEGMGWYHNAGNNTFQLRSLPGQSSPVRVRAELKPDGTFARLSNQAQVDSAGIVGRNISDVRARVESLGYIVEANGRIRRPYGASNPHSDHMVGLRADATTGEIRLNGRETIRQVQVRIEGDLTPAQRSRLTAARSRAGAGQEVVLLEGIYDLGTTWRRVIDHYGGTTDFTTALGDAGVSSAEANRIVTALLGRSGNLQLVSGTGVLRRFDYARAHAASGGTVPAGGAVHHGDPLYLAGTHELLSGLDGATHDAVHELFNNLELPSSARISGTLSPAALRAQVPQNGWRRGAATLSGTGSARPGHIDYTPL